MSVDVELGVVIDESVAPVPLVDIGPFFGGDPAARDDVARAVGEACETIGFVMIGGHGVPDQAIADLYAVTREFFELPLEEKRRYRSPVGNKYHGYSCPGKELGDQADEREAFNLGPYDDPAQAFADGYPEAAAATLLPALWPDRPHAFRDVWRSYYREMEQLARRLFAIFEVALDLPTGWFDDKVEHHQSNMSANYYAPGRDWGLEPSPFRFKAHVDGSVVTILYQDDGPGHLQLHQRGAGWRNVRAVPGTYVVNLGELMARWTNGRFVATPHRVMQPEADEPVGTRLSVPWFFQPAPDVVIEPLPQFVPSGEEPRYGPVVAHEWLLSRRNGRYGAQPGPAAS